MSICLNLLKSVSSAALVTRSTDAVNVHSVRHFRWRYVNKKAKWFKKRRKEDENTEWMKPVLQYREELRKAAEESEGKPTPEPHMLHAVRLVKPIKGSPWWEKEALEKLGITKFREIVPVKNIPSCNEQLRLVSHLLEITPLTFPQGLPEHPSDFQFCYIKSNGEMVIKKRLVPEEDRKLGPGRYPLQEEVVDKQLARTLEQKRVHMEYFQAHYKYKHNQDGKEYRYTEYPGDAQAATKIKSAKGQ